MAIQYLPSKLSPSTRRVWIEILELTVMKKQNGVTLHAEGVD